MARQLLIVNRQDEGAGRTLLLRKLTQITIAGHPQHFKTFGLNRLSQSADAKTRRIVGAVILVNDDDGKAEFHAQPFVIGNNKDRIAAQCK